jgi:ribosomal protein S14
VVFGDLVVAKRDRDAKPVFRRYEPQGYDKRGRHIIELVPAQSQLSQTADRCLQPGSHRGESRPVFALSRLVVSFR